MPWQQGRSILKIHGRSLETAEGKAVCSPEGTVCPGLKPLAEKAGNNGFGAPSLALDIPADTPSAALNAPFSALAETLPGVALHPVCIRASVEGGSRCVNALLRTQESMKGWMAALEPLDKLRLVIRNDGMEVVTRHGKIPGPDRFGPSIPARKGVHDFDLLYQDAARLSARFPQESQVAVLAGGQTTMQTLAMAMDTMRRASGGRLRDFILVY